MDIELNRKTKITQYHENIGKNLCHFGIGRFLIIYTKPTNHKMEIYKLECIKLKMFAPCETLLVK